MPFDDAVVTERQRTSFPTNKRKSFSGNPDHRHHHHHHYHQQQQHQQQQQQLLLEDRIHPNGDLIGLSHSHTLPHNMSHHLKGKYPAFLNSSCKLSLPSKCILSKQFVTLCEFLKGYINKVQIQPRGIFPNLKKILYVVGFCSIEGFGWGWPISDNQD